MSLVVKATFVVLTFAGRASLWAAIAADMGVTLLVVTNALRLLRNAARIDGPSTGAL
jgi:Cd2+/Zn2+-exporting ATPase